MKIHPDLINAQSISGYGPGWVRVGNEKIETSIVIGSRGERFDWSCGSFSELSPEHFDQIAVLEPELVIFGSGTSIRFPPGHWIHPLIKKQIGIETMDTQAACRTYNILAGEGRKVIAALILESTSG
jgi:uncharacterized protein